MGNTGILGIYDEMTYNPDTEWSGQCISVARIRLSDLDDPEGKAKRWDGKGFHAGNAAIGSTGRVVADSQE